MRALVPSIHRRPEHHAAVLAALRGALDPARDFEVRARAVMALGDLRLPEATGDLIALRKTSDEPVLRYLAARELASIGGPDGIRALREALADGDPRVRETAAHGAGASAGHLVGAGADRRRQAGGAGRSCGAPSSRRSATCASPAPAI